MQPWFSGAVSQTKQNKALERGFEDISKNNQKAYIKYLLSAPPPPS